MLFLSLHSPAIPPNQADGIEFRLDLFSPNDIEKLECLDTDQPLLFTFRKEQLPLIDWLLSLKPALVDLEWDSAEVLLQKITEKYPTAKIILSYHNHDTTPENLEAILTKMQSPYAYAYKLATMAHSTLDALRTLHFVKTHPKIRLSGICMGKHGQPTRIFRVHFWQLHRLHP